MNFIKVRDHAGRSSRLNPLFIKQIDSGYINKEHTLILEVHGLKESLYYTGRYEDLVKESKGELK